MHVETNLPQLTRGLQLYARDMRAHHVNSIIHSLQMSYCVCYAHCNIIINYKTLWLRLYSVHRRNNKHDTLQLYHPHPAVVVVRVRQSI